ncbi:MAG: glycosyltransferase [Planctomycetaceae bacterium]|nr:glycosyltransferase [Planctomycetaceae bacterium]
MGSKHLRYIFFATTIATCVYLGWRIFFTLPFGYGWPSMVAALVLLFCELVAGIEMIDQYLTMVNMREPELPVIPTSWYPDVDVLVTTHNEPVEILYKTINACIHLDYPDKSKVHVFLCDDTNRPEMRELAATFGVGYFGLTENTTAKAGNLNNALSRTHSPLVANFDADMIPRSSFLLETVPYFFLPMVKKDANGRWIRREEQDIDPKEKIGFIQTTQSFYNPDLFQYNLFSESRIPNEQDYFSRELNIGRNRNNSPLYTGSNTVLSREALMAVGGIAVGSLTEDFETGLRIQALGYRTFAVSKVLSMGLAPHSITGLLSQRERWGRGCVQAVRDVKLFRMKGLGLGAKLSYFTALVYWWSYTRMFVYIVVPILSAAFHFHVVDCSLREVLFFWVPYFLLSNYAMKKLSGGIRNQHWNNVIYTSLFPYLVVPIVSETLGFKKKNFVVTRKNTDTKDRNYLLAMPHMLLLLVSVYSLSICLSQILVQTALYNLIIIFWLLVNSKNLIFAILFMFGRPNNRLAPRFYVSIPVTLEYEGRVGRGVTTDVSETGMAVRLAYPQFIPNDANFEVRIQSPRYEATMRCSIVHVDPHEKGRGWRYCLRIEDIDEENRREYSQIVFDRPHTLPATISDTLTIFDDFSINIGRRLDAGVRSAIRKLPRIRVGKPGFLADGREVRVEDYNYKFVWLSGEALPTSGTFTMEMGQGIVLYLEAVADFGRNVEGGGLFAITNWQALLEDATFQDAIAKWVADDEAGGAKSGGAA